MKDLGKTKFCLGLQIEHLKGGILVHQEAYIAKVLKRFYMDKSHPLSTPMVVDPWMWRMILSNLEKKVKNYLVLKYHISMQ